MLVCQVPIPNYQIARYANLCINFNYFQTTNELLETSGLLLLNASVQQDISQVGNRLYSIVHVIVQFQILVNLGGGSGY